MHQRELSKTASINDYHMVDVIKKIRKIRLTLRVIKARFFKKFNFQDEPKIEQLISINHSDATKGDNKTKNSKTIGVDCARFGY